MTMNERIARAILQYRGMRGLPDSPAVALLHEMAGILYDLKIAKQEPVQINDAGCDIAKEVRARVADLNDLVDDAARRGIAVSYGITSSPIFQGGGLHKNKLKAFVAKVI